MHIQAPGLCQKVLMETSADLQPKVQLPETLEGSGIRALSAFPLVLEVFSPFCQEDPPCI